MAAVLRGAVFARRASMELADGTPPVRDLSQQLAAVADRYDTIIELAQNGAPAAEIREKLVALHEHEELNSELIDKAIAEAPA